MSTVEISVAALAGAGGALVLLLVIIAVASVRGRRRMHRRLSAVAQRLPGEPAGRGTEEVLLHLEHSIDDVRFQASTAASTADRLRAAVEAMDVGVVLCDSHGESLMANRAATARLRRSSTIEEAYAAVLDSALAGRRAERDVDDAGPPPASFRLSGIPLDDDVRSLGAAVVVEDLTIRRHADAGHRQLLADLARELNEPLTALAVLADAAAEESVEVRRRLAGRARVEAGRARQVLDDVVELSRLAQDRAIQERLSVTDVVARARDRAASAATARSVSLGHAIASGSWEVQGERSGIETAVAKLIELAVAEAGPGGAVELRIEGRDGAVEVVVSGPAPAGRSGVTTAVLDQAAARIGATVASVRAADGTRATTLRLAAAPPG